MSDVTTALIGAASGALASIPATLLTHFLANRRTARLNRIKRKRLKALLEDPRWTWRKMETLANAVGSEPETTAMLLLEIGAQRSTGDRDLWTLRT
jgi:hypothetical protein